MSAPAWDGLDGTAGGAAFGARTGRAGRGARGRRVRSCAKRPVLTSLRLAEILAGQRRVGVSALARFASALRTRPIEFLQRTAILSLESYAFGLDPLYFLPEGPVRYDARIYMREINPRHQVPEGDMTRRNSDAQGRRRRRGPGRTR